MSRLDILRAGISKTDQILEIGPYFNPIAPKGDGYQAVTIDVFDADQLRRYAAADPNIPDSRIGEIEDVDLVGSAADLEGLTRARFGDDFKFDWILSSHNIEHIPNPIRFLQQCDGVLRRTGRLRLAIPDKRYCFDHYRQLTDTTDWLEAFFEDRRKPTVYQVFRAASLHGTAESDGSGWKPATKALSLYREWFGPSGNLPVDYIDTHCWTFTPDSFELLIRDVVAFGMVNLRVEQVTAPGGFEFFVDLSSTASSDVGSEQQFYIMREQLLRRTHATEPTQNGRATRDETSYLGLGWLIPRVRRETLRIIHQLKSSLGRGQ